MKEFEKQADCNVCRHREKYCKDMDYTKAVECSSYQREAVVDINKFWDELDIAPVNKFFDSLLNTEVEMKKVKTETRNGSGQYHYKLVDERNIADEKFITRAAWCKMNVETFGAWLTVDDESGAVSYACNVHLNYTHHGGGMNVASIGYAKFANGEWAITAYKDNSR